MKFILFVALRYFKARRKSKGFATSVLAVLGVIVGVMTLIAVMSVMNGFQLSYIENILEISSYHMQIDSNSGRELDAAVLEKIGQLENVKVIVPFAEIQALVQSEYSKPRGCIIRALPADVLQLDSGFKEMVFNQMKNTFDQQVFDFNLKLDKSVVIGTELANHLFTTEGGFISLTTLEDISFSRKTPVNNDFYVAGLFKSGYGEVDIGMVFISLKTARTFLKTETGLIIKYGIKLVDRYSDMETEKQVKAIINNNDYIVKTWREINRGFFGALAVEKLMLLFLPGLIFIVVCFNIFHSLRRMVYERLEDIGILKAIGALPGTIRYVFIFEGFLIGFVGSTMGLVLGLLIATQINRVFDFIEDISNFVLSSLEQILIPFRSWLGEIRLPQVEFFSPNVFYLTEVPVKVVLHEVILIFIFALCSATLAAYFASKKVSLVKPSEILRCE